MTFVVYLLIVGAIIYFVARKGKMQVSAAVPGGSQKRGLGPKKDPREIWKQVYETASMEEALLIRARLEEEGIACILYEQGKKDIQGNLPKGVGVAVPGTAASAAQASIAKIPV